MVDKQEKNQVKIGFQTRIGNVVKYSISLLKEEKFRTIHFSAIGGAIGSLVNVVEVLKTLHPGLYQINKISSVSHQTLDSTNKEIIKERLSPKMDATLTFDTPNQTGEGFQEPYSEDVRKKLEDKLNESRDRPREDREDRRPRGGYSRGGRDGYSRGGRDGFRGRGFSSRGGFRGESRGGFRGESREGFRGRGFSSRGGFRGESRGGFRGESREGFRGRGFSSRGGFRGESRGGYRGESRGGYRGESRGQRGNKRD
jgi:hypothetical protein